MNNQLYNELVIYTHQGMGDQIECNGLVRTICRDGLRGKQYDRIAVLSKECNKDTVEFMYRDEPKIHKVYIIPDKIGYADHNPDMSQELILSRKEWDYGREYAWVMSVFGGGPASEAMGEIGSNDNLCVVGHKNYFHNYQHFLNKQMITGQTFYDLVGLPWSDRVDKFYVERDHEQEHRVFEKLNPHNEKYIFVHDSPESGSTLEPHLVPTQYKVIKNDPTENIFYMLKILYNAEEIHCMSSSYLCLVESFHKKIDFKKLVLHWHVRKVELTPSYLFSDWKVV